MDGPTAVKKMREMGFTGAIFGVTGAFAVAAGTGCVLRAHAHARSDFNATTYTLFSSPFPTRQCASQRRAALLESRYVISFPPYFPFLCACIRSSCQHRVYIFTTITHLPLVTPQGADIVLGKPLKISELKAAIRAYTRKQRELAILARQEEEQQLQGTNQALENAAAALGTDDNV